MKKFEEELNNGLVSIGQNIITKEYAYGKDALINYFKDWISPEDHQAEIGKIELQNLKYREEIARMQKSLRKKNKAIKELNGAVKKIKLDRDEWKTEANQLDKEKDGLITETEQLKSQLEKQRPEIPEITKKQAEILNDYKNGSGSLAKYLTTEIKKRDYDYFARAWLNGYTVAKEKRFYLKNKLTGCYLYKAFGGIYAEQRARYINDAEDFNDDCKFTQSQIDSMETGSYEQIKAEDE